MKEIKLKKIKPMFNTLVTTMNKYTEADFGGKQIIEINKVGALKEHQTVLFIGNSVRPEITVGSMVKVNPAKYEVRKYAKDSVSADMKENYNQVVTYNFNVVEIGDEICLLLGDNDIQYVVEEFEEVEVEEVVTESKIILPQTKLILPR